MSEKRKARIFNTLMFVRVRKMLIAKIKQKKKKKKSCTSNRHNSWNTIMYAS